MYRTSFSLCLTIVLCSCAVGQVYEVIRPDNVPIGQITVSPTEVTYQEPGGPIYLYSRAVRFDTPDGRYLGYYNVTLARVLKFPRRGDGGFYMADLDDLVPIDRLSPYRLRLLSPPPSGYPPPGGYPATGGYPPPLAINPYAPFADPFLPDPIGGPPLIVPSPRPTLPPPTTAIQSRRVPLPDLPPVTIELVNGGQRDINVSLLDRKKQKTFERQIPAGQTQSLTLQRDGGEQLIETFETIGPLGDVVSQQRIETVPPASRYQITVHQWRIQSISIDRTAGANNAIDDINMQGQAVGSFDLPPGPSLEPGSIDVYRAARSMGNQGLIGPLVLESNFADDNLSPLEKAVLQIQRQSTDPTGTN